MQSASSLLHASLQIKPVLVLNTKVHKAQVLLDLCFKKVRIQRGGALGPAISERISFESSEVI